MKTGTALTSAAVWRVVIIEDSPEDRDEIRRLLLHGSDRRYQFVEADTGAAGVRAILDASRDSPDCVVLDYALPDTDAVEVLASLVGPDGLTVCPVVVLTGTADSRLGPAVLRAGAQDFIGKSWMTAESVTRAVDNAVERWAMSRELHARTAAVQSSEAQLRLAVEVAGLGVNRIDYRTDTIVLDTIAAALFGLKGGVPMPRSVIHTTFHADDKEEILQRIDQSLDPAGDGRFAMEHRVVHRDGSVRWLSVRKQVAFGDVGGIRVPVTGVLAAVDVSARKQAEADLVSMNGQLLIASVRQHELTTRAENLSVQLETDLAARKQVEEELRESQHFIHSVLYNLFAFVGVMTVDGTLTDANLSSLEAAGIPASEVLGKKFWDCYWWSYSPEIQAQLRAACARAASGEVVRYDVPVRMASDARVWIDFQVSPLRDTKGRITHLIPSALEIEVRHAAEQALRESEERFRIMADGLPLLIWVHDAQGELQFVNKAYREFFNVTPQQVAGPNWHPLVHPEDLGDYAREFSDCVRDRRPFHAEVRVRRFDGQWRRIESRARPRFSASGEFLGMVGSSPDITERKQVEEALRESEASEREARAQAEVANRSKDTFLATLSHELRTPLNAILGWAVLLRTTPPADGKTAQEDIDHGLAIIERSARAQGKLIEDVLDVARITSGKFVLDSRPLDLTSLVFAAVDAVRPTAKGKSLVLEVRVGEGSGCVWINGDSLRLQQAISNLLTNAIKFTPKGGAVAVGVDRVTGPDSDRARLTVTDTGMGIDAEFLPSIFERFKQAGEGTTRSYGGLGLGLAVVRHIVEAHGGSVRATSEGDGKGATFILELPTTMQTTAPLHADKLISPMAPPRLDGLRVLVVDDEEDSRLMAKRVLEGAGASVVIATSAEEGYQLAVKAAAGPQVIVSDIGMPREDGYSLLRRVRMQKGSKDLPAVAMTAFAAPEDKRRALEAGFQAHIAKPIEPNELVATVAGLVGTAGQAEVAEVKKERPRAS